MFGYNPAPDMGLVESMRREPLHVFAALAAGIVALGGSALATTPDAAITPSSQSGARGDASQQEGTFHPGITRQYVDNGDGTITAISGGLMWEKLSRDGSIHDYNTVYTWTEGFTKITALNTGSFAGHGDWRLPNINELRGLGKYTVLSPAIDATFNTSCVTGCTILSCSCTQSFFYWSDSRYQGRPGRLAWHVGIGGLFGFTALDEGTRLYVRGVRGP